MSAWKEGVSVVTESLMWSERLLKVFDVVRLLASVQDPPPQYLQA